MTRDAYLSRLEFYLDTGSDGAPLLWRMPRKRARAPVEDRRPHAGRRGGPAPLPSTIDPSSGARREVDAFARNRAGYLLLSATTRVARGRWCCASMGSRWAIRRGQAAVPHAAVVRAGPRLALFIQPHHWRRSDHPATRSGRRSSTRTTCPDDRVARPGRWHDLRSGYLLSRRWLDGSRSSERASAGTGAPHAAIDDLPRLARSSPSRRCGSTTPEPRRSKLGSRSTRRSGARRAGALELVAPANYTPAMPPDDIASSTPGAGSPTRPHPRVDRPWGISNGPRSTADIGVPSIQARGRRGRVAEALPVHSPMMPQEHDGGPSHPRSHPLQPRLRAAATNPARPASPARRAGRARLRRSVQRGRGRHPPRRSVRAFRDIAGPDTSCGGSSNAAASRLPPATTSREVRRPARSRAHRRDDPHTAEWARWLSRAMDPPTRPRSPRGRWPG